MRTPLRVLATFLMIVCGLITTAPTAAQAIPSGSGVVRYQDYLKSGIATNGADQCLKPLADRVGAWTCAQTIEPSRSSTLVPGFCQPNACWNRYSSTTSDFAGWGLYGYGSTTIGTVNVSFDVTLNGGQARDKPVYFESTAYVRSLHIEGDRLYYSAAYPNGNAVNGGAAWNFTDKGAVPANTLVAWTPNGYVSYENTVQIGGVVHEWVWTDANYPGAWYLWGKSIKFDRQSSGAYYFGAGDYLPAQKFGAGWHN